MLTASGPANMASISILIEKMTHPLTSQAQTRVKGEEWKNNFSAGKRSKHDLEKKTIISRSKSSLSCNKHSLFFQGISLSLITNMRPLFLSSIFYPLSLVNDSLSPSFICKKKKLSSSFITACTLFSSFPQPTTHILIVRFPHHQQHWSPLL